MKAEDVAHYLSQNPGFFEEYSEMLAQISIPHPHGGQAIALSERQVVTLRDKIKILESKLGELIRYGEENDAIGEKMHRLTLALLGARDLPELLSVLVYNLRQDFEIPHVALRLWGADRPGGAPDTVEFQPVSEALRRFAESLAQPFCGPSGNAEAAAWFGEAASHIRSVALMQLNEQNCKGMLALGSEDVLRFYPDMGTLHLRRLGGMTSAALARFL